MKEQKFYDKLVDWLGTDLDNDNITVSNVHSFNEDGYYQRIFFVTEKHHLYDNDTIDVYVVRMFGFSNNDNIHLSVDYEETMTYTELLKNMGDIFKFIIDRMDK